MQTELFYAKLLLENFSKSDTIHRGFAMNPKGLIGLVKNEESGRKQ
jgi:hypothetical protein